MLGHHFFFSESKNDLFELLINLCLIFLLSLQMTTAWTISPGVTWFPSMAFATTSSMDSSAASPAPTRGHKVLIPLSLWLHFLWRKLHKGHLEAIIHNTQNYAHTCVFSSWSTWLMIFFKEVKERNCRLFLLKNTMWLQMLIYETNQSSH